MPASTDSRDNGVLKHDWDPVHMGQSKNPFKWICKNCGFTVHQPPEGYVQNLEEGPWNCALRVAWRVMES